MQHDIQRNSHRTLVPAALLAASIVAVISLSQCRMVEDRLTGVAITPASAASRQTCVHHCNDLAKQATRDVQHWYTQAKRACGSDKACRKDVDRQFQQKKTQIREDMQNCKRGCYNEGAGSIGR